MDARVDEVIKKAKKESDAGNYRGAVALLQPLLKHKLSPQQKMSVVAWLGACYHRLDDFKAALPHAQRQVVLAKQLHGARSLPHARALQGLCMVHRALTAFPPAREGLGHHGRVGPATT